LETMTGTDAPHVVLVRFEGNEAADPQRIAHLHGQTDEEWQRLPGETADEFAARAKAAVSGRRGVVVLIAE